MNRRISLFIVFGILVLFGAWYVIAPLYIAKTPETKVATIIKPSEPLEPKFLRGHWTMLFFGYMRCPKVCPKTLNTVREAWNMFPDGQAPARFVFANITAAEHGELQEFLHNYRADFTGLTNNDPDMQYLYDKLHIFAQEQGTEINHTAALMLIDPQGRLVAIFTPPFTAQEIAADLRQIIS